MGPETPVQNSNILLGVPEIQNNEMLYYPTGTAVSEITTHGVEAPPPYVANVHWDNKSELIINQKMVPIFTNKAKPRFLSKIYIP